jgi:hypothetical protein
MRSWREVRGSQTRGLKEEAERKKEGGVEGRTLQCSLECRLDYDTSSTEQE